MAVSRIPRLIMDLKLIPEIKALWIAALRSGEYKQGKRALVEIPKDGSPEYCCLGVLCDILEKRGVLAHIDQERNSPTGTIRWYGPSGVEPKNYSPTCSSTVLPDAAVTAAFGAPNTQSLLCANPAIPDENGRTRCSLAERNDDGATFNQIADLIETHL